MNKIKKTTVKVNDKEIKLKFKISKRNKANSTRVPAGNYCLFCGRAAGRIHTNACTAKDNKRLGDQ
jgi:hypothetical protein